MISINGVPEIIAIDRDYVGDSLGYERVCSVQIEHCIACGRHFVVENSGLPLRHRHVLPYVKCIVSPLEADGGAQRRNARKRLVQIYEIGSNIIDFPIL